MNKLIKLVILSLSIGVITPALAGDSCKMVICMYGQVTGDTNSECSDSYQDFFGINVFKKGKFKASKTSDKRKETLMQCDGADPKIVSEIISKFGTVRK